MKRIIIAVICLVLAVFLAVFGYFDLRQITFTLEAQSERALDALQADNAETIEQEITALTALWEQHEQMLGAFVHHGELEEVDLTMRALPAKLQSGDYEEISDDLEELLVHFAHLRGTEAPEFKNIF